MLICGPVCKGKIDGGEMPRLDCKNNIFRYCLPLVLDGLPLYSA